MTTNTPSDFISVIAARVNSPGRRPELLRHVTDLFLVSAPRLSENDIILFDDILAGLIVDIEISAKALLAMRLAPIPNAPPQTIRKLAFDDAIEVSGPVLSLSERLDEETLIENARSKSQAHLLAIAQRHSLSAAVTDVLIDRGDQQVVLSTTKNSGAAFSDHSFTRLVERSGNDEMLALTVGARPDIPPLMFRRLLQQASAHVRAKLEALHPNHAELVTEVVSEVADRIERDQLGLPSHLGADFDSVRETVSSASDRLGELARRGSFAELAVALARTCEMPVVFVESALRQRRSDTVLLLGKANGISWPTVKAILEFRARHGFIAEKDIERCMASYEQIAPNTAQKALRLYKSHSQSR